jgi:hypothetical protein
MEVSLVSDKVKKHDDFEELSLLLDEMNAGRKPECEDRELAELLAVAELVKNTSGPICPPPHILDQTVNRILEGIEAEKPKPSRSWLFSGTLGTAAAVLLVIGLNMLPSWKEQVPVAPPPPVVSQQKEALQAKAVADEQPTAPQAAPGDTTPAPKQQPPVTEQKTSTTVASVLPSDPPKPQVPRDKSVITEERSRTSQAKSIYIPSAAKPPTPALPPLKLPGRMPDLVVTDTENGVLRQVFDKGTPQEITITQRLQPADEVGTQATSQSPSVSKAAGSNQEPITTVKITISGQEVTVEGRLPRQELLRLAGSLTQ